MSDHETGQVQTSAAEVYDSLFVPALFGNFVEAVADATAIGPTEALVDIACGTGTLTREVKSRTAGRVVGVDVNPGMLAVARRHGGDIAYVESDAVSTPFDDGEFDVATCQFGLMFYPDPAAGIAEMTRVAPRGVIAVWDSIDRSDGYLAMQSLFRDELGEEAAESLDAPFALGRDGVLEHIVSEAGVDDALISRVGGAGRFSSLDQWVTTEVRGWTLGDSVSDDQLDELIAAAHTRLGRFATADGCELAMAAKLATWG